MRPFDATNKGIPMLGTSTESWHLFDEKSAFPVAVLNKSALVHNSASMAAFCREHGVSLAPHGKTTMSPELFAMQVNDGAWAITAANVHQARVMQESGVPRVIIANEVTASGDIAWLARQIDAGFPVMCYVDSLESVHLLQEGLSRNGASNRLDVLVELGVSGGRTGARSLDAALQVARAVGSAPLLRIAGVAGFEGIISGDAQHSAQEKVADFLGGLVRLGEMIVGEGLIGVGSDRRSEFVLSAGGSVFFDQVVEVLGGCKLAVPTRVVVRSGCYLSHDDGVIAEVSPLGDHPRVHGDVFHAALEVWAPVLSRPEPTRLVVGAGKRDVSTDGLLPVMKKWVRRGTRTPLDVPQRPRATRVDDQHAYIDVDPACEITVGDYVALGISHPCTTFDKWRVMLVVDDDYCVIDVVTTRF